jgi:hypothetical protein
MKKHLDTSIKNFVGILFLFQLAVACQKAAIEYEKKLKPEVLVNAGMIQKDTIHFSSDTVYVVAVNIVRNAGQVLEIEKGTLIKMRDRLSVTINPGAVIKAEGSASEPIVFTSAAVTAGAGVVGTDGSGTHFWYGIRIIGNASIQPQSSSGVLKYVRIEFAGGDENFSGTPSLLLQNVGSGTEINHIQVSYSFETSSFEFRGGTCNASNLISYASGDYDYYIEDGYTGKLQFLLAYRHPFFPINLVPPRLAGMFINGDKSNPAISNLSVIGPDLQRGVSFAYTQRNPDASLVVSGGAKFQMRNSLLAGFPLGGIHMNNRGSSIALNNGASTFDYSVVHASDSNRVFFLPNGVYPPFNSKDFKEFMLSARFNNRTVQHMNELKLNFLFEYEKEIPRPAAGSPLLSGSGFGGPVFSEPFFKQVGFIGAVGEEDWLAGWTNLSPLQTKYN